MKNKKTLKFYIAIFIAKCASFTLKLLKRNATYMPGKIALQLCPDFLGMLEKPETIIGVIRDREISSLLTNNCSYGIIHHYITHQNLQGSFSFHPKLYKHQLI